MKCDIAAVMERYLLMTENEINRAFAGGRVRLNGSTLSFLDRVQPWPDVEGWLLEVGADRTLRLGTRPKLDPQLTLGSDSCR